jgi:hypothetical protein
MAQAILAILLASDGGNLGRPPEELARAMEHQAALLPGRLGRYTPYVGPNGL